MTAAVASFPAALAKAMEVTGYFREGRPTEGVLSADELRRNGERATRYRSVLDPNQLGADAVFELSGVPCVYFKHVAQPAPDATELLRLHQLAWNQGLAPLLWVVTPAHVHVFNCYSKPARGATEDPARHCLALFKHTAAGLEALRRFAGRRQLDTGEFWKDERAGSINRRDRVDEALLRDLKAAEKGLGREGLGRLQAHSLLGRSIFVSYLQDRGILQPEFFQGHYGVERFLDILPDVKATYRLFRWVRTTFNGDLFPLVRVDGAGREVDESQVVTREHLGIVRDLIAATRDNQLSLWPYKFDVIPIELISSIYERFAHAADAEAASALSTHYTPINLVDLVLSQVFRKLGPEARILDLTCGSGVFLVEALRRLVALRRDRGEPVTRELIRETLHGQVHGIDISREAVQIAAFSLYLTALELDPDPQPPEALTFLPLIGTSLFASDAFDTSAPFNAAEPFAKRRFDAIVGNPPWTQDSKHSATARAYCAHPSRKYPLGWNDPPDQALLWRLGDFSTDQTRIGLVLHGRHFFSQQEKSQTARAALLRRYAPEVLVNLADLRLDSLFSNATAPAMVLVAEGRRATPDDQFALVAVERSSAFRQHGIVEIGPEHIKRLGTWRVSSDPNLLKIMSWGNARDAALIARLEQLPRLGQVVPQERRGQGFQALRESTEDPKPMPEELADAALLESGELTPFLLDESRLGELDMDRLYHRPRKPRIYEAPVIVTVRGLGASRFVAAMSPTRDIVYSEAYYGFAAASAREASFLNGILNSSLATYFLFLTSSSWGVERDELKPEDLLRLPIAVSELNADESPGVNAVVAAETAIRERLAQGLDVTATQRSRLDQAVFNLHGLDEAEQILVRDLVNVTIDLRMRRDQSPAARRPTLDELEAYATAGIDTISPYLRTPGERSVTAEVFDIGAAPLNVVRFTIGPTPPSAQRAKPVSRTRTTGLEALLSRIARHLEAPLALRLATRRNLQLYDGNDVYIVKPAELRHWTRAAGLHDADAILAQHLRYRP